MVAEGDRTGDTLDDSAALEDPLPPPWRRKGSPPSRDDADVDHEVWDEEADAELTRRVVAEAEAEAAAAVELDLELYYDDDELCAKLHPCTVNGELPPAAGGASSSPALGAPPSSPVQGGPPPRTCPAEPRLGSCNSDFPCRSPPKSPATRRALDLLEVGRRSVTNLDTGEVLTVDDVAHMYQETGMQRLGAFDMAREQSPGCRRATSASTRTRSPGQFKEVVSAAFGSPPTTPSRLSSETRSGQTRSRAASELAGLFLSQYSYSPGGHLTSPPKRRLVGSSEDDGGSRFSLHSPTRSPRDSPIPSTSSPSARSSPLPASLDSPRSRPSSPEPFVPLWSSVRDARPSTADIAQWRASHFGKLGGVGGAPAVLRAQFLWLQRSVTRSSLQEAMDATIADDVEPLLVRGELRVATTASAARAWHALRWRPCRLVLDDDRQRDAKTAAAAAAAAAAADGSLSARAASFGSSDGGGPPSRRALSFGGRVASRRDLGPGSPRGSGRQSPRGLDAGSAEATSASADARPVALPAESDRLLTRDEAERALLAAERKVLDGVQLLCGGGGGGGGAGKDSGVCFRLEHMLAVGETKLGGCDFWVLVQTAATTEPQRLRFRCSKPAERERWLHALTELARRRVLTQHVAGLRWSSMLEHLEAEGAIARRSSPSPTDETPSTASSAA